MITLGHGLFISPDKIIESETMTTNDVGKAVAAVGTSDGLWRRVLFKLFSKLYEEQRVDGAKLTSAKRGSRTDESDIGGGFLRSCLFEKPAALRRR